jgi:hypothetical protein
LLGTGVVCVTDPVEIQKYFDIQVLNVGGENEVLQRAISFFWMEQ